MSQFTLESEVIPDEEARKEEGALKPQYRVLSLGAGVQSSTLALMAARGELPRPDFAVFADTGDEPAEVYEWLDKLTAMLPFKVVRVQRSVLSENLRERGWTHIPCFVRNKDGEPAIGKRQCTKHWKIEPIQKAMRAQTGLAGKILPAGCFESWQGISTDEVSRAKISSVRWIVHRFPLLELRMNRGQCVQWLSRQGIDRLPKSACVFCTYRADVQWQESKERGGAEWDKIVTVDRLLNRHGEFLHRSLVPIDQIDFSNPNTDHPELSLMDECDGMCGV